MSRMSFQIVDSTTQILNEQPNHRDPLKQADNQTLDSNPTSTGTNKSVLSNLADGAWSALDKIFRNSSHHQWASLNLTTSSNNSDLINVGSVANHILVTTSGNVTSMDMSANLTHQQVGNVMDVANSTSASTTWFDMPKMDNFMDVFSLSCSGALILGGLVPYIPQYLKIKKSGSSDGFSTYVCLTLLLANILRIAFWFGHRFELPLLYQSFVMIAGMLAMMEICTRVRNCNAPYIIGVRPPTSRPRRSIIGKILGDAVNSNTVPYQSGLNNESTPIYSVASNLTSSSSSSPTSSADAVLSASEAPQSRSQATSYHQQDSIEIECEKNNDSVMHAESLTQYNSNALNSFSDFDSSILAEASESTNSRDNQQQPNNIELANHSYSNGYISNQRKHRLGLVKWLSSSNFWDWDDLFSYIKFLLLFSVILGCITYLLIDNHLYIETLGFVALFAESMLGMPQLLRNYIKKSTRGMSVEMVIMWLSGDLFKTLYFILRKAPAQFIVCGAIQVTVDVLILIQVFWYRRPKVNYSKLPKST